MWSGEKAVLYDGDVNTYNNPNHLLCLCSLPWAWKGVGVATDDMLLVCRVMYNELSLSNEYIFFKLPACRGYSIKVKVLGWSWAVWGAFLGWVLAEKDEWVGVCLVSANQLLLEAGDKHPTERWWGSWWYLSYGMVEGERSLKLHRSGLESQLSHSSFALNDLLNLAEVPQFTTKTRCLPSGTIVNITDIKWYYALYSA